MIRIAQGAQLALQQDVLALAHRLHEVGVRVRDVRADALRQIRHLRHEHVKIERLLVVQAGQQRILDVQRVRELGAQHVRVIQLAKLQADLLVLVAVERRNARLGGAKGVLPQALLLELIKLDMIRHHDLRALGDENLRLRHALGDHLIQLAQERLDVQRHARADDVDHIRAAHAAGQQMQRKATVIVDDRVSRVRAALETDDNVGLGGEHIGDLALALVAPVCADDSAYHGRFNPFHKEKTADAAVLPYPIPRGRGSSAEGPQRRCRPDY